MSNTVAARAIANEVKDGIIGPLHGRTSVTFHALQKLCGQPAVLVSIPFSVTSGTALEKKLRMSPDQVCVLARRAVRQGRVVSLMTSSSRRKTLDAEIVRGFACATCMQFLQNQHFRRVAYHTTIEQSLDAPMNKEAIADLR